MWGLIITSSSLSGPEMPSLLYLILCISAAPKVSALLTEGFDPTCQSHYTQGYGYRIFFKLPPSTFLKNGLFQFNFSLSGPSNGHVLLSEKTNTYPGYEMVIGAGGNGFSELRKYISSKLEVKTSQVTKNVLSSEEIRNFSITIDQQTVILLSRNNGTENRILFWKDSAPLDLKYVSFCAWTGVSLSWYYDCKGVKPIPEEVSTYRKLKKTILQGYDPYSIPVLHNGTLEINTSISLNHINLDVKKSSLTAHGKFNFSWFDFRVKWDPKDFDNISSVNLLHREIWLPEFTLDNSVDDGSSPMGKAIVRIAHTGVVSWEPNALMHTWCSLDLKKWPFDRHSCDIKLGLIPYPESVYLSLVQGVLSRSMPHISHDSTENDQKELKLSATNTTECCAAYMTIWNVESHFVDIQQTHLLRHVRDQPELTLKNMEWDIKSVSGSTTIANSWKSNKTEDLTESHQALILNIELERQSQFYIFSYFVPVFGSIMIALSSFWLPVFSGKRLILHTTGFLLLMFTLLSLDHALPSLSSTTPHIISVCCHLIILSTCHIIFTSCVTSTVSSQSLPPKFVTEIVTNPTIQSIFCLFGDYGTLKEDGTYSDDFNSEPRERNHFTLFGTILDRVLFGFSLLYICVVLVY